MDRTIVLLLAGLTILAGVVDASGLMRGSPVLCEVEGALVEVPAISSDPCITCICQANKQVKCDREICPNRKHCYLLSYGQNKSCCDMCRGCSFNGQNYTDGEDWKDPNDPCKKYVCQGGIVTQTVVQCYSSCRNPSPPEPGTCCPSCPEDEECPAEEKQMKKKSVQVTPQTDPCVTCDCKGNSSECSKRACPVLPCPAQKQVFKRGACCPECVGSRKVFNTDDRCLIGLQSYKSGDSFKMDPCTSCTCNDSTAFCERQSCPPLDCRPEQQVKSGDEQCCPRCRDPEEQRASCNFNGKIYENGERWRMEQCTECSCRDGQVSCLAKGCSLRIPCPPGHSLKTLAGECCPTCVEDDGVCTVYGDPHYRTFDGQIFNYQGSCKYVLAKDCSGGAFSVEVLNEARYSRAFSWTKTVTVKANGTKIRLGQYLKIHVNHKPVKLPYVDLGVLTVFQEDRNVLVRTNMGIRVLWDGSSYLEVSVPPSFHGKLCGLCGNYNGNPSDDFLKKGGGLAESPDRFGDSWRVGKMKRCKATTSSTSPEAVVRRRNPDVHVRALRECNVLKSAVFRSCHKTVSAVPYYNSCYIDAGECRPWDRCYCESLTAYARHCARAGKELSQDWRSATGCDGIRCGNGQQYMSCAPACRKTCKKPRRDKSCRKPCRPGCYCPPGTVWHRKKCVPLEECPS